MSAVTFPEVFNLADYFLFDRLKEGMGGDTALRFGDREPERLMHQVQPEIVRILPPAAPGARCTRG